MSARVLPLLLVGALACSDEPAPGPGAVDAAPSDSGQRLEDGGSSDTGSGDLGAPDGGSGDAGSSDVGGSEDLGAADGGAEDLGAPDGGAEDLGAADGGAEDLGAPDGGAVDAGASDSGAPDAGAPDSGAPDAGGCNDGLLDSVILDCGGLEYARILGTRPMVRGCPDSVVLSGNSYPDVAAAIAGESCNPDCVWRASTSVSYIDHCNRRNGYIVFRAADPARCPDVYEFSSGLYASVMDYEAATPCP